MQTEKRCASSSIPTVDARIPIAPRLLPALYVVSLLFSSHGWCPAMSPSPTNLLINPGFEQGADTPEGWQPFSPGGGDMVYAWEHGVAASGDRCVMLMTDGSGFGMWQQRVNVAPGTVYRFHAQVAFEAIIPPGHCELQLVFRDSSGSMLEMVNLPDHHGTRDFALDFPHALQVRAPASAHMAEVNLFLQGPGMARFDDVSFSPAPTGRITGTVTSGGTPLTGAQVRILGNPWGQSHVATSDDQGQFLLEGIPESFPRYQLTASHPGYKTRSAGKIGVSWEQDTDVNFDLQPGLDPVDDLQVAFGTLAYTSQGEPSLIPADALIPADGDGYPPGMHPFLQPDAKIHSDHPDIQSLAQSILSDVPDPQNTREVAYAVYTWVSQHIDHDGVFDEGGLENPFTDITSGIWQTLGASRGNDSAWCFGRSFVDWAYSPAELLAVRSGICVEHAMLVTALLRALNIPARPFSGSMEFYAQTDAEHGAWVAMSTTSGRTLYREQGRLESIDAFARGRLTSFPVTPGPMSHEDWDWATPGLWRETHPWGERYEATAAGLDQATADLENFASTGDAPRPAPTEPGPAYQIHYRHITLRLYDMMDEHMVDVRFPLVPENGEQSSMDVHRYWTNHPECVVRTYIESVPCEDAVEGSERWYHIVFNVSTLLDGGQAPKHQAWLPHITQSSTWQTAVTLQNPTDAPCSVTLECFDSGGVIQRQTRTLEGHSTEFLPLEQGDCGTLVHNNPDLLIRASYQHLTDQGIAEFSVDESASTELFFLLPQYHAQHLTWAGLACMNPNAASVEVTLDAVDGAGRIVGSTTSVIPAHSRIKGRVRDILPQVDFTQVARVHARSQLPISGIVIAGHDHEQLLFTRAVAPSPARDLIIPHIATDMNTWENLLIFDNTAGLSASLVLELWHTGVSEMDANIDLNPGQTHVLSLNDFGAFAPECGILRHVPAGVLVRQSFRQTHQGGLAEFLLGEPASEHAILTLPAAHAQTLNWMGLALCNPSEQDDTLVLTAFGDGDELATTALTLSRHSRQARFIEDLFPGIPFGSVEYLEIKGPGSFQALQISGFDHSRLLFGTGE